MTSDSSYKTVTVREALEAWRNEYKDAEGLTWYDRVWMTSIVGRLESILKILDSSEQKVIEE